MGADSLHRYVPGKGEGENGFGTFGPCAVHESERGFGFASIGLEAISVIFSKFVGVPVKGAER